MIVKWNIVQLAYKYVRKHDIYGSNLSTSNCIQKKKTKIFLPQVECIKMDATHDTPEYFHSFL